MTEQWQELKETITEMRDNDGTGTQQETCKFLANYMEVLEKQIHEPMRDATEEERKSVKDYIKSISKPTGVQFDAQLTDLTAEEREIIDAIHKMGLFRTNYANDKVSKAVSKIIKAYESQPTDAVSRTLVHEAITASIAESENPYEMWQRIEALPSVTPRTNLAETSQDCISRQAVLDMCKKEIDHISKNWQNYHSPSEAKSGFVYIATNIYDLHPVTPQQKIGRWIAYEVRLPDRTILNYRCSVCGRKLIGYNTETLSEAPFCHCGAKMVKPQESEE